MTIDKRINIYTCSDFDCGYRIVTIDLEEGTTPFGVLCKKCKKRMAYSAFYKVDQTLIPEYEWYKPNLEDIPETDLAIRDHVKKGGLLLRKRKRIMETKETVTICYLNWKGSLGIRRILPKRIWWGKTEYHPEEQWLLDAIDLEKNLERTFAMKDIHFWKTGE